MTLLPLIPDYFGLTAEQSAEFPPEGLEIGAVKVMAGIECTQSEKLPWNAVNTTRQALYNWIEYNAPIAWREQHSMNQLWFWVTALAVCPGRENPAHVAYFRTHADFESFYESKGETIRRFTMKPGKFAGKYLGLEPAKCEEFANWWGQEFADSANLRATLKRSTAPDEFARVYTMNVGRSRSDYTVTRNHKSLTGSCMQKNMDSFAYSVRDKGLHPAFVYGSGDFEIWSLEYGDTLQARCVVALPVRGFPLSVGPIYALTQSGFDRMESELSKAFETWGYATGARAGWQGRRLLRKPLANSQTILAPYIDVEPRGLESGCDSRFVVLTCRDHEDDAPHAHRTDGVAYDPDFYESDDADRVECEQCGARVHSDDSQYVDSEDAYFCDRCIERYFSGCEHCHETYRTNDLHEVITDYRVLPTLGRICGYTEQWCESCRDDDSSYCNALDVGVAGDLLAENSEGDCVSVLATYAGCTNNIYQRPYSTTNPAPEDYGRPALYCVAIADESTLLSCADVLQEMRDEYANPELPLNPEMQGV